MRRVRGSTASPRPATTGVTGGHVGGDTYERVVSIFRCFAFMVIFVQAGSTVIVFCSYHYDFFVFLVDMTRLKTN